MQFETEKDAFLKVLQTVQNAISTKSTLPILSNLLMETMKNDIKITATDLDIGISSSLSVNPKMQGAVTIPAKKLLDIIKELPNNSVVSILLKKNNTVFIDCGKTHFKIVGLPKDEFPQPPEFKDTESIILPQKILKEMISLTVFAVSRDETRYVLNGVLFIIKDKKIKFVATDGRRLAVIERELPEKTVLEKEVIIPTKTAQELSKILDDENNVRILFSENQIFFDMGKTKIISRLVEGEFPNYKQVIPEEIREKIKVNRAKLLSAARRASLFTNQDSLAVKLDISKNKMIISKNAPYIGELKEELDINYKGKNIAIGFNPTYIIELLKNLNQEDIDFEIGNVDKPGVIRIGGEYIYVVLPMQLT
ncbi:MAG: DNA polymerase III subunit beta [Candidatus Omnitrophica bacterium]|nr:DNA polymerase III subunit beta [Candidatus Omnitrophota bacterium]